jgi:hypothetical protein
MNLSLKEVKHLLKALDVMSPKESWRDTSDHDQLIEKLKTYQYRLTRP